MIGKIFIAVLLVSSALAQEENPKEEDENKYKYVKPEIGDLAHLAESFHDLSEFKSRWILSKAKKDGVEDTIAKYDGKWELDEPKDNALEGDLGLMLKSEAKHAAISSKIPTKFEFDTQPLIIQYEVKFQKTQECGGAYIKLLAANPKMSLDEFGDKTLYSIMFGPDKCGHEGKMHFIVQHENPVTGKMTEHHAKAPSGDFSKIFDDKKVHLVTLVVRPANTFEIFVDKKSINSGSLFSDMTPSINPPKEIDDPSDSKPEDWDEREKIPDADATKPDDWDENAPKTIVDEKAVKPAGWLDDEPEHIPDPDAVRPKDWDTEEDGEWEAPLIPNTKCKEVGCGEWKRPSIDNPNYKGKWVPPLIANPAYKGIWAPKKISNPDYFEDTNPFGSLKPIAAVGFELWSMQSDITFDNIILATDQSVVDQWAAQTWDLKQLKEGGAKGVAGGMLDSVLAATEDKPWLWVLYVVVIILPFVLIYTFCFPSKDKSADRKKTDEPTPDDVPEDDNVSNRSVESSEDELLVGPDDQPEAAAPTEAPEEAVKPADAEPVAAEPVVEPPAENEPAEDMPELEKVEEVKEAAKEEDTKTPEPELSEEEETATPAKELKSKEEAAEPEIVLAAEKPAEEPVAESEEAKPEVVKDIPEPAVEAKPEPVDSEDEEPITNGVPEVTNGVPEKEDEADLTPEEEDAAAPSPRATRSKKKSRKDT